MKRHDIANALIRNGYSLVQVTEYKDFIFEKNYTIGDIEIRKQVSISYEDGIDKVEARKMVNGQWQKLEGDKCPDIIQHDYEEIRCIIGSVMMTDDGREFVL